VKCRFCNSHVEPKDNWRSILAVAALVGWLSFMAGQVWTKHQIGPLFDQRIEKDDQIKKGLRDNFVPNQPEIKKKG